LRDLGPSRQRPNRLLSFAAQPLEDRTTGWIGERSEQHIVSLRHLRSITRWLLIDVQPRRYMFVKPEPGARAALMLMVQRWMVLAGESSGALQGDALLPDVSDR
jgi:hypothetical protein